MIILNGLLNIHKKSISNLFIVYTIFCKISSNYSQFFFLKSDVSYRFGQSRHGVFRASENGTIFVSDIDLRLFTEQNAPFFSIILNNSSQFVKRFCSDILNH